MILSLEPLEEKAKIWCEKLEWKRPLKVHIPLNILNLVVSLPLSAYASAIAPSRQVLTHRLQAVLLLPDSWSVATRNPCTSLCALHTGTWSCSNTLTGDLWWSHLGTKHQFNSHLAITHLCSPHQAPLHQSNCQPPANWMSSSFALAIVMESVSVFWKTTTTETCMISQ